MRFYWLESGFRSTQVALLHPARTSNGTGYGLKDRASSYWLGLLSFRNARQSRQNALCATKSSRSSYATVMRVLSLKSLRNEYWPGGPWRAQKVDPNADPNGDELLRTIWTLADWLVGELLNEYRCSLVNSGIVLRT